MNISIRCFSASIDVRIAVISVTGFVLSWHRVSCQIHQNKAAEDLLVYFRKAHVRRRTHSCYLQIRFKYIPSRVGYSSDRPAGLAEQARLAERHRERGFSSARRRYTITISVFYTWISNVSFSFRGLSQTLSCIITLHVVYVISKMLSGENSAL